MTIEHFFEEILPAVERYGKYALLIQKVACLGYKGDSDNEAERAFTEADLIVQEGISRALKKLSNKGYNFRLLAEEDSPYNHEFSKKSNTLVALDPIDGTLLYTRGHPWFSIIVSIFQDKCIQGALVHTPADGRTYCASHDIEESWVWLGGKKEPWKVNPLAKGVVSMGAPKTLIDALIKEGIPAFQFGTEDIDPRMELNSMLRGEIAGFFKKQASCFDWGPISFIVEKGEGFVSDFNGNKDRIHKYWKASINREGKLESIIATGNKKIHDILIDVINRHKY